MQHECYAAIVYPVDNFVFPFNCPTVCPASDGFFLGLFQKVGRLQWKLTKFNIY